MSEGHSIIAYYVLMSSGLTATVLGLLICASALVINL